MDIHILDWIMWFVVIGIYWAILDKLSQGEFTNELGGLIGCIGILIITVIYCFVFWYYDWINVFHYLRTDLKL